MQTFYTEIRFSQEIFDKEFPGDSFDNYAFAWLHLAAKSDKNVMMLGMFTLTV